MNLQWGRCLMCPTRRCGEGRKEAKRWFQSKTARCKILFVAGSLQNALSTDKGIMNSHVNLSPIKLSAKGSVGWNSKAEAPQSHAKVETTCRLSWHMSKKKREVSTLWAMQINIYVSVFSSMSCYFAQLYLESMLPSHLKLDISFLMDVQQGVWWLFFVAVIYIERISIICLSYFVQIFTISCFGLLSLWCVFKTRRRSLTS